MKPIDKLGLGPTRKVEQLGPDEWEVTVKPPSFLGLPAQKVKLNKNQYLGYLQWDHGGILIQDALPDLTPSQREILMTGLGDEDFDRLANEEDDAS